MKDDIPIMLGTAVLLLLRLTKKQIQKERTEQE
jgi:hypothetical protein